MEEDSSPAEESSVEMDAATLGIDPLNIEDTDEIEYAVTPRPELLKRTLLARAESWVGHNFEGGKKEQCANFIRRLLAESCLNVPPAQKLFDANLTANLKQGSSFANSFFSADNGSLLGYADLEAGDLICFRDTYEGDFPAGCITHVALWVDGDTVIDRSTAGEPVRKLVLDEWWKQRFVVGLRPFQLLS